LTADRRLDAEALLLLLLPLLLQQLLLLMLTFRQTFDISFGYIPSA